jgi:circadian clock protein KaiB
MQAKSTKRGAKGSVTGNHGQERGVQAAATSKRGNPLSFVGAGRAPGRGRLVATPKPGRLSAKATPVVVRSVKRAKARVPIRARRSLPARPVAARPRRPAKLWQLRQYVTGQTLRSQTAFANLKQICETHLKGRYRLTVIDLLRHPQLAQGDQILAVPTVVRRLPKPVRIIIGTLSDTERVLVGLDLRAAVAPDQRP